MRHLFVINPTAGKNTDPQELIHQIGSVMEQRNDSYQVRITQFAQHGEEMIRAAAKESDEPLRVYVFGGDGTLNEAVNAAAGYDHVAITVCPTGSGNDFLKIFGQTRSHFSNLEELVDGEEAVFDLIECNGRYSINLASVGLDARIGVGMVDFKHLPLVSGKLAYLLSLVTNVIKKTRNHFRIRLDGEAIEGDYTLVAACNGRYYGGGFCPVPTAMPDDNTLYFVLVKAVSRLQIAALVKKYGDGRGDEFPELIRICRGKEMIVESPEPTIAQLDGEKMESNLLSFRLSAKKIHFIYPRESSWAPASI
ncbi:MAG: YegS/Rv2252/BmrU family lipid kinase [Oscillospiraceae bacterium]|nr:YegS/Rv2252/BmrU family lipid kinase [Oscillospiraceae bacterium]